mmetsp:Transcript_40831/g.55485  ORF Transcript_40831/g.55485 Transcript_40831/m.55485 type:complete len:91 (+) Transcript_40831:125-397(+)
MQPENANKLMNQEMDEDKTGLGQHYCISCTRYFITDDSIRKHFKTKEHKKRVKVLKEEPYTIEESERAGGLFTQLKPSKVIKNFNQDDHK